MNNEFIRAFAAGQLIIDCPRMELHQLAAVNPQVYRGRGMLTLLSNEEFQLRMYVDKDDAAGLHPHHELMSAMRWIPGEVIPPDEYYTLSATDLSGAEWTCAKMQAKLQGSQSGLVISGPLFDNLRYSVPDLSEVMPSEVKIFFFENLKVPYDQSTLIQTTFGSRKLSTEVQPCFASFDANEFQFKVQKVDPDMGSTIIRITSKSDEWPEAIETRVEEALRYVTFSPVEWCIVEKSIGCNRYGVVKSRISKVGSVFDGPIDYQGLNIATDFWRLFVAYFQCVINHPDSNSYHDLSGQLFNVISADTRQMDIVGLLVSIAVEGVLNSQYSSLAKPSGSFLRRLDVVEKVIRRLQCLDGGLTRRLVGALSSMRASRPKDKLKVLVDNGVINQSMAKAWEKLRNTTAHAAVKIDPDKAHEMWAHCNIVYAMLNRLVFQAIGYSGKYKDFSTSGWPMTDFRAVILKENSLTGEEVLG